MKTRECLLLLIIIAIINQSSQQYLSLTNHKSQEVPLTTGTWKDLLGLTVECPNREY